MTNHSHDPLPRFQFFFSQRPCEIRQHEQLMRQAALTEHAAPHFPATGTAGETGVDQSWCLALQTIVETEILRALAEETFNGRLQQAFAGAMGPPSLTELEAFDFSDEPFDDPLGIAQSWEEKYKKRPKDEAP